MGAEGLVHHGEAVGGEGQQVAAGSAQRGDDGPLAEPARAIDAGEPVHDALGRRRGKGRADYEAADGGSDAMRCAGIPGRPCG